MYIYIYICIYIYIYIYIYMYIYARQNGSGPTRFLALKKQFLTRSGGRNDVKDRQEQWKPASLRIRRFSNKLDSSNHSVNRTVMIIVLVVSSIVMIVMLLVIAMMIRVVIIPVSVKNNIYVFASPCPALQRQKLLSSH